MFVKKFNRIFILVLLVSLPVFSQKSGTTVENYFSEAKKYLSEKQYDKSITVLTKIIEIETKNKEAYKLLGNTYFLMNDYEKALLNFKKAIEIDPNFAEPYSNMGFIYSEQNKLAEALKVLNKAIELKPTLHQAFYNRAVAHKKLGKIKNAIDDYSKVIQLNPDDDETIEIRRDYINSIGFYKKAVSKQNKPIQKIVMPKVLFDSPYEFDRISAIIDFVNAAQEADISFKDLPANALEVYYLDYYVSEIHDGGINQFIYNSNYNPLAMSSIKNGLIKIGATQNSALFNNLLAKKILVLKSEASSVEGYTRFARRVNKITNPLKERFYQIEEEEPITELNHKYIETFSNLELVSDF